MYRKREPQNQSISVLLQYAYICWHDVGRTVFTDRQKIILKTSKMKHMLYNAHYLSYSTHNLQAQRAAEQHCSQKGKLYKYTTLTSNTKGMQKMQISQIKNVS